jgi:2Fe-2S ferredoxin
VSRVTFVPLDRYAETRADETVLDAARRAGAPLGNACGAVGVCARCRVRIIDGATNLSAPTNLELRMASSRGFADDERLACQAVVNGDCSVTTTYW